MGVLAGQPQHRVSEADLDVLEMITHIPPRSSVAAPSLQNRALDTVAALRRPPIDPIVLAASLGSGPNVTRHHFHHTYADTHSAHLSGHSQQMPVSERRKRAMEAASRPPPPPTAPAPQPQEDEQFESSSMFVSCQAPRSVRLARAPCGRDPRQSSRGARRRGKRHGQGGSDVTCGAECTLAKDNAVVPTARSTLLRPDARADATR